MTIYALDVTSMFMTGRARLIGVTAALMSEKLLNEDINLRYPCQKGVVPQQSPLAFNLLVTYSADIARLQHPLTMVDVVFFFITIYCDVVA